MSTFEQWHPVDGLPVSFIKACTISASSKELTVQMHTTGVSSTRDLILEFTQVWGVMIHDELHHPDLLIEIPKWGSGNAFPCLIKRNSDWSDTLHQTGPLFDELVHYQLITHDAIIDVLSDGRPDAVYWSEAK